MTSNAGIVVDQFTRQAAPFASSAAMRDEDALRLLVEFSGATPSDTVLDVACGPGLVVAAFARVVHYATGIDLTPAMIDKAREHAAALALTNVAWRVGNVLPLPFPDRSFSLVVSRFAFHHFPDPAAVMREMVRVCTRPGRVVVADMAASDDPGRAAARPVAHARSAAGRVARPVRERRHQGAARNLLRRACRARRTDGDLLPGAGGCPGHPPDVRRFACQ
jgi:ubiquinone/menaquinone biosynthesis C-methylase UbiE